MAVTTTDRAFGWAGWPDHPRCSDQSRTLIRHARTGTPLPILTSGDAGAPVCLAPCADTDGWLLAAVAAERLRGRLGCNSADRGRNGCTQRTGRYSRGRGKDAAGEKIPMRLTSPDQFRSAPNHHTPDRR